MAAVPTATDPVASGAASEGLEPPAAPLAFEATLDLGGILSPLSAHRTALGGEESNTACL